MAFEIKESEARVAPNFLVPLNSLLETYISVTAFHGLITDYFLKANFCMLPIFFSLLISNKIAKEKQFLRSVKIWLKDHWICISCIPHRTVMNEMHQLLNKIIIFEA